jgi:hypothetical protein
MSDEEIYYFGCMDVPGHYLFRGKIHQNPRYLPDDFPVSLRTLDGGLLPPMLPRVEGRAEIIHCEEWTILAFWDNSVDSRSGANSNFIIRGWTVFENAVEIAKKAYPYVWERFKFEVYKRE